MSEIKLSDIGQHLRVWRKEHGYTLKDVAERTDITIAHISDVERGNRGISLPNLDKLLMLYGIRFLYVPAHIVVKRD